MENQISISIGKSQINILLLEPDSDNHVTVTRCTKIQTDYDITQDVFRNGNSKAMTDLSGKIAAAITAMPAQKLAVTLDMNALKFLEVYEDPSLTDVELKADFAWHAANFLDQPETMIVESCRLESDGKANKYALIFVPKIFIARLRLLVFPSRKKLNLIDTSHFSLQELHTNGRDALVHLTPTTMTLSLMNNDRPVSVKNISIENESDAAYFIIRELQEQKDIEKVYLQGSAAIEEFVSQVVGLEVHHLSVPQNVTMPPETQDDTSFLEGLGCGLKALALQ
jgi:hypothetical protein